MSNWVLKLLKKTATILTATALTVIIIAAAFFLTQTATSNQIPTQPPPNWQIKTTGDTKNPQTWILSDLTKMPLTDVIIKSENATYRGVTLSDFCVLTGAQWDTGLLTVIGESGQKTTLNIYQAWNSTTYSYNHQYNSIVLAFIKDNQWLSSQDGGPVKLIAPYFSLDYQIERVTEVNYQPWTIKVTGNINYPITITGKNLTVFQTRTIHGEFRPSGDPNRTSDWTGISILDLIDAAHPSGNPTQVSIVGVDNYSKTFTITQLSEGKMMLGYQENGQPLPVSEGGPFRLFAPSDAFKWGQYWVKYVVEIKVT
jgi:DMSO/TMAO reductase YedYZ molybdopterin-dependent catalytic subunit